MLQIAGYICSGLLAVLLWTLARSGLLYRLRWFGVSLAIQLIQARVQFGLSPSSAGDFRIWLLPDALFLAAMTLAAIEIYLEVTREVHELGKVGAAVAFTALALGVAAAVATSESSIRPAYAAEIKRTVFVFLTAGLGAVTLVLRAVSNSGGQLCLAAHANLPGICRQSGDRVLGTRRVRRRATGLPHCVALDFLAASVLSFDCGRS